jgi:hypothetical protein
MPVRKPQKFKPDEVVEVLDTFAAHMPSLGTAVVFKQGTRVLGNNEAVAMNPQLFVRVGAPQEEADAQRRELYAYDRPAHAETPTVQIVPTLRDEDAVVPCSRVIGVPEGKKLANDDAAVRMQRDDFVPVVGPGLTRENSHVALATMTASLPDGTTRTVYQGQWVAKDDPFVQLHPHQFGLLLSEQMLA